LKSTGAKIFFCSIIVTCIFSIRWGNCLPFSGYTPAFDDVEDVGYLGRYLIYAGESFNFPLGEILNLSFPFKDANIAIGSLPLFAIPLKLLSKWFPQLITVNYFIFTEIIAVFISAILTGNLFTLFKVRSFLILLLGITLTSLSFPLLYRSSSYFGVTFIVLNTPVYLAFMYAYIRLYYCPNDWKMQLLLCSIYSIAALIDYYLLLGICILSCLFIIFNLCEYLLTKRIDNGKRLAYLVTSIFLGISLSFGIQSIIGNDKNLESPTISLLEGRYKNENYGGGLGGGYHVADVLSIFVSPGGDEVEKKGKRCGPESYLKKLGFPMTTEILGNGQNEGFSYIGTTSVIILLLLVTISIYKLKNNWRHILIKAQLRINSNILLKKQLFSILMIAGISTLIVYIISWGYIIHIAGVRLNSIPTPTLIIATFWTKFMFARSIGKLALPFTLFVIFYAVILLNKQFEGYIFSKNPLNRKLTSIVIIFFTIFHVSEIWGYLKKPENIIHGNEITNVFEVNDQMEIKNITENKRAIMVVPEMLNSMNWAKICYALSFYSKIPVSSATIGFPGEPAKHLARYRNDIKLIERGEIQKIVNRYGNIVIAIQPGIAETIMKRSNLALRKQKLINKDVVLLTIIGL